MAWYKTGTVSVTNNSATVTGSGTNFVSGAQVGFGFQGPNGLVYEITAINSSTSLTITPVYGGSTASGQAYAIVPTQGLTATLASDVTDLITDYQTVADNAGAGKFGDGSAASPGIRFVNDQDTGFFKDTANEIAVSVGGTKVGEFTSTGIDGTVIGGTTPAAITATTFTSTGIDDNAASTALTIDSSGNLLVGKSSTSINTAGTRLIGGGSGAQFTADGTEAVALNRLTSDGNLIWFGKAGSKVGSIGTSGDDLTVGNDVTTVKFHNGLNAIHPNGTGSGSDGLTTLGWTNNRFKDLYLSGGVYLGGTGSANKLDRYEEGDWTLTCQAFDIANGLAHYRVIGDVCYAWFYIDGVTNINSNAVRINLPFTSASTQGFGSAGSVFVNYNNISPTSVWIGNSSALADFYNSTSTQSNYTQFAGGNIFGANNSSFAMYGQFQYRIA